MSNKTPTSLINELHHSYFLLLKLHDYYYKAPILSILLNELHHKYFTTLEQFQSIKES